MSFDSPPSPHGSSSKTGLTSNLTPIPPLRLPPHADPHAGTFHIDPMGVKQMETENSDEDLMGLDPLDPQAQGGFWADGETPTISTEVMGDVTTLTQTSPDFSESGKGGGPKLGDDLSDANNAYKVKVRSASTGELLHPPLGDYGPGQTEACEEDDNELRRLGTSLEEAEARRQYYDDLAATLKLQILRRIRSLGSHTAEDPSRPENANGEGHSTPRTSITQYDVGSSIYPESCQLTPVPISGSPHDFSNIYLPSASHSPLQTSCGLRQLTTSGSSGSRLSVDDGPRQPQPQSQSAFSPMRSGPTSPIPKPGIPSLPMDILASPFPNGATLPQFQIGKRYQTRYEKFWEQNVELAAKAKILLYVIPKHRRDGVANLQWSKCRMYFLSGTQPMWYHTQGSHVFDDPINGDRVFRFAIDHEQIDPIRFFLKDEYTDDRDHPNGPPCTSELSWNPNSSNYYTLYKPQNTLNGIATLRDGVLVPTDRVSFLGVRIILEVGGLPAPPSANAPEILVQNDGWTQPVLHYLDEISGHWHDREFQRSTAMDEMSATLLEVRSVTFAIRDKITNRWLKPSRDQNFRINYPGSYAVFTNGTLIECSSGDCSTSRYKPNHAKPPLLCSIATPRTELSLD